MLQTTKRWIFRYVLSLVGACATLLITPLHASPQPGQAGDFGLGAMFGAPTGLSLKYWVTGTTALDGGLAWHFGDDDRFQIHADHLWHINVPALNVPYGRLPLYVG